MASDAVVADKATTNTIEAENESKEDTKIENSEKETSEEKPKAAEKETAEQKPKDAEQNSRWKHDQYDSRERSNHNRPAKRNARNKSNYDSLAESNDEVEIRQQVEFYFSDSNLPTDEYLLKLTGGHENKPVPLKTIHNFKRMRHFQPFSVVRDAVKASEFLKLDDKDEITRAVPLDEKFGTDIEENRKLATDATIAQSVYAKGFGREYSTLQLDIENFFKPYGPVKAVRMRRLDNGLFKGSVFVEFESEELAKNFLELDPKPRWYSNNSEDGARVGEEPKDSEKDTGDKTENTESSGTELKIMSKKQYLDEKKDETQNGDGRSYAARNSNGDRGDNKRGRGGRGRGGRGRGGRGSGGRSGGDRRDRRDKPNGNDEASKKRSREDDGAEGEAKKSKISDE